MVKPGPRTSPCPIGRGGGARALLLVGAVTLCAGCGVVSKTRLDECHRVTQTLRSENGKLRDVALDLRSRNQDLSQRAVDDAGRLSSQQDAIQRLERSVMGYQSEREKMAASFESLMRQVRMAVNATPGRASISPGQEELGTFALTHPGWSIDSQGLTLSTSLNHLFESGGSQLTDQAKSDLASLAAALSTAAEKNQGQAPTLVVAAGGLAPSAVRQAAFDPSAPPGTTEAQAHFLAAARASRVRESLIGRGKLDPGQVQVAAPISTQTEDAADSLIIHLSPAPRMDDGAVASGRLDRPEPSRAGP